MFVFSLLRKCRKQKINFLNKRSLLNKITEKENIFETASEGQAGLEFAVFPLRKCCRQLHGVCF